MSNKVLKYCLGVFFLLVLGIRVASAQTQQKIIQTAYLEKFANYIIWPDRKNEVNNVFKILIIGDLELCKLIKEAFADRKIKDKIVEVLCSRNIDDVLNVDMVFLASNKAKDLELAIDLCKNQKFLLVTDSEGFAKQGAHINFYITMEQTLHFEMNKASLDRDSFKVDFLLLDFAKVVK